MEDIVIKVEGVAKKFCRSLKKSIAYGIRDISRNILALRVNSENLRSDEFWALDGVSFDLKRTEVLGICGPNGAGKTTLLKLLSVIFMPDKGRIEIKGRVGSLIEIGAGFHPMLSCRENIYVNAAVLGMSRREINNKLDSIIDFADIGDFIDSPVKYYSSGMFIRLGFAVAIHSEPDILLLDEILSVGDALFQEKCLRQMEKIRANGTTIVFVSHNLYRIEAMCSRAIWLNKGKLMVIGDTRNTISAYLDYNEQQENKILKVSELSRKTSSPMPVTIEQVELTDLNGKNKNEFAFGEGMMIRVYYKALRRIEKPLFNLRILDRGFGIIEASMLIDGRGPDYIEGKGTIECRFDTLPLTPKSYDILLFVRSSEGIADITHADTYSRFRVTEKNLENIAMAVSMALNYLRDGTHIYVPHHWSWQSK